MKKKSLIAAAILVSAATYAGDVFYWRVDHINDRTAIQGADSSFFDWSSFGDSSNWSLDPATYSNPNGLVPGSDDLLYTLGWMRSSAGSSWTMGYFDLGGRSWTVAGFSTNGCPASTFLYRKNITALTNGTLTVTNPAYIAKVSHSYKIYSGATLIYPSGVKVEVSYANPYEDWKILRGGRIEAKCGLSLTYLMCIIESGGTFLWDPDSFDMTASIVAGMGSSMTNSGTLLAPHGILWNGTCRSDGNKKKEFEVAQMAGEMRMGGNFTKTTKEYNVGGSMRFVLGGGTLYAESDVAFTNSISVHGDEVSASMPAAASATVDVAGGATLDMRIFTYGAGASLTKTGAGTLLLSAVPDALSVSVGKVRFAQALLSSAGLSFASGTVFEFGAAGNSFGPLSGYANVSFALAPGVFSIGSEVLSSSDADFLAYVASSIEDTLPADTEAVVSGGVLRIAAKSVAEFSYNGVASLSDASAWGGTVPAGEDIYVTGASTVARIDSGTPAFNSITVTGGATLEVVGSGTVLPPVNLSYPAAMRFADGSTTTYSTIGSLVCSGDANGLPVFEIATNAVVTVPIGTSFKNMEFRLYGEIGVPDTADPRPGLTFGTAASGETAYFALKAIGGKIRIAGSSGVQCRSFMKPADTTARVVAVGDLLMKDVTFPPYPETGVYLGNDFGVNNPQDAPFTVVLDGTVLPCSQTSRIYGSTHIKCINGGGVRSPYRHPGVACIIQVRQYAKVTIDGPESSFVFPYNNVGTLYMDTYVGGSDVLELKNGGWIATHNTYSGASNAVVAVSNGTWRIGQMPYVPADGKPSPPDGDARNWFSPPFAAMGRVRIAQNSTLWMQSSSDLQGTEWDRDLVVADVPIIGAGNLVVTNGTPGYGLSLTFVNGANTDTGRISVAPSSDPTHLYFADGANWAGTVVSDGRVSLTNLTDASAAATVSFGSVEFTGDFPLRVWRRNGAFVADQVNLARPVSGTGGFLPVPNGFRFAAGDTVTIGTWAEAAVPADATVGMARKWRLVSGPSGTEGFVTVSARYTPPGTVFMMR